MFFLCEGQCQCSVVECRGTDHASTHGNKDMVPLVPTCVCVCVCMLGVYVLIKDKGPSTLCCKASVSVDDESLLFYPYFPTPEVEVGEKRMLGSF